ncbi:MAG: 4-alpha-glucanotransferase [Thermoanaerobaculia bacterium]
MLTHSNLHHADGKRAAGALLHPTSLPGLYGVGDLGDELTAFLDWAVSAGMHIWQVLPLNPPGYGHSPYGCLSSFAGNPLLISPQRLLQENLLPAAAVASVPKFRDDEVDFEHVIPFKLNLLRESWKHFQQTASPELRSALEAFIAAPEQSSWLESFAIYMSAKQRGGGAPWWEWDRALARGEEAAIASARKELASEIQFHEYVQFLFFRQWKAVRDAAHSRGIRIMGDSPIYVAGDSADVWAHRELFQLDDRGLPTVVAGVPPDYFSATGQRWGNPLYRWDLLRESGYRWWVDRVRANLRFADIIRLDHFRGFSAYWEIPAHETTAVHGRWLPGPGRALFDAIRKALGDVPLIAEDLGFITPEVHDLRHAVGLPGMKILQFGFTQIDSPHLPHRYEAETVVYTGTHDNDTARGWFDHATPEEKLRATTYLGVNSNHIPQAMIRAVMTSVARLAVVPVQDILGLGTEARMNRPGEGQENWNWRMAGGGVLTMEIARKLRSLVEITGRL